MFSFEKFNKSKLKVLKNKLKKYRKSVTIILQKFFSFEKKHLITI